MLRIPARSVGQLVAKTNLAPSSFPKWSSIRSHSRTVSFKHKNTTWNQQIRMFSSTPNLESVNDAEKVKEEEPVEVFLTYEGPFAPILKILKRVSVFSCGCTVVGVPLLAMFGNPDMQLIQRIAVGLTTVSVAIGTTALLHSIASPYVRSIVVSVMPSGKQALDIETFTLFGNPKLTTIPDMNKLEACPDRYFATVRDPSTSRYFYLHDDWDKTVFYDRQFYEEIMTLSELPVAPEHEKEER